MACTIAFMAIVLRDRPDVRVEPGFGSRAEVGLRGRQVGFARVSFTLGFEELYNTAHFGDRSVCAEVEISIRAD